MHCDIRAAASLLCDSRNDGVLQGSLLSVWTPQPAAKRHEQSALHACPPEVGFFCAEDGSSTPPVVFVSALATSTSTRSPFGAICTPVKTNLNASAGGPQTLRLLEHDPAIHGREASRQSQIGMDDVRNQNILQLHCAYASLVQLHVRRRHRPQQTRGAAGNAPSRTCAGLTALQPALATVHGPLVYTSCWLVSAG